jgi:protein transport protein SEC61 subunit gamma-like protein
LSLIQRRVTEIFQTLRLAKKTSKDDYLQHLRLVILGLLAVGGIAFVMKLIAEFVTFGTGGRFG